MHFKNKIKNCILSNSTFEFLSNKQFLKSLILSTLFCFVQHYESG